MFLDNYAREHHSTLLFLLSRTGIISIHKKILQSQVLNDKSVERGVNAAPDTPLKHASGRSIQDSHILFRQKEILSRNVRLAVEKFNHVSNVYKYI